jgi:hypothetical protein
MAPDRGATDLLLDKVVRQLEQDGSEQAKFFIGQLRTAARVLPDWLRQSAAPNQA